MKNTWISGKADNPVVDNREITRIIQKVLKIIKVKIYSLKM